MLSDKQLGVYRYLKDKYGFEEFLVNYKELADKLCMSEAYLKSTLAHFSQMGMLDVRSRIYKGKMETFRQLREV